MALCRPRLGLGLGLGLAKSFSTQPILEPVARPRLQELRDQLQEEAANLGKWSLLRHR
jgi:hypothetical protein